MSNRNSAEVLGPGLYLVATPIGNARDVTLRALDILGAADVLAAEDTRSLRRLMEIHGVPLAGRHVLAYHDHNGAEMRPKLLAHLAEGKSVAYASEAGTPLVSDPGYALVRDAAREGFAVTSAPGASAALAALCVAGLPSDRFTFAGFPPTTDNARQTFLNDLAQMPGTLILYETPRRLEALLTTAVKSLGGDRPAAICRELTKRFEDVRRGPLETLLSEIGEMTLKGEVVVCIGPAPQREVLAEDIRTAMAREMETAPVKEAARRVAEELGVPRRDAYQIGLSLR